MWVSTLPRSRHVVAYAPRYRRQSPMVQANSVPGSSSLLGTLGISSQAKGAAQGASMGAKVGSVVPVVGTAVGAVVGAIAGFLLAKKNYINVGSDNKEEDEDVISIWPQYTSIAGGIAGRDIGLELLERIFRGAVYSRSDFTKNNAKKCFHKGCLKYPGDPDWIHQTMVGSSRDKNTFQDVIPAAVAAGVTDPRQVVDQYYIPANASRGNGWAVPATAAGRQVLVDIADVYMAKRGAAYFYGQGATAQAAPAPAYQPVQAVAAPQPTVNQPVQAVSAPPAAVAAVVTSQPVTTSSSGGPSPLPAPQSTGAANMGVPTVVPVPVSSAGQVDMQGLVQQLLAQGQSQQQAYNSAMASMQAAGVQPTPQVQQATAQAVQAQTAGAGGMFSGMGGIAIVAAMALASFALARPVGSTPSRRRT
jgi:hypothetical protein